MRYSNKLRVLDSTELYSLISSSKKNKKTMDKIRREIDSMVQETKRDYCWDDSPLYNYTHRIRRDDQSKLKIKDIEEITQRLDCIESLQSHINYEPEMLLILPETISIEQEDFKTPFPFIIESPVLNTNMNFEEIVTYLLKKEESLDNNEQMVY